MNLSLTSTAFNDNQTIPARYTCDGADVSPSLSWAHRPDHPAVFALIVDDPDAPSGVFTHWVLYDLPADVHELPEHLSSDERPGTGGIQGKNSFGKLGYGGPCPPPGPPHHYHFTLYALDTPLGLAPGASKQQVLDAMRGHIIGQAEIVGRYQRR